MDLLKDKESLEIFRLLDKKEYYLGEIVEILPYDEDHISKYVAQMERAGIIQGRWDQGEDRRWRRYYRTTNWEWSRLIRNAINLEQVIERKQKIECPNCGELDNHTVHDTSYFNYNLGRSVWFKRYTCGVCGYKWRVYDDLRGNKE